MLSLEETNNIVNLLQSERCTLQQILEQFHKSFKPEIYSRLSLSLRCLLDDNYYNTNFEASKGTCGAYQSELLITYFLLYILSTAHSDDRIHLPNTRSVLYEQLQKIETFIREKRHKKEIHKDKTKTEKDWDDDEAVRVKTVLKFFILQCITGMMKDQALRTTPLEILRADMKFLEAGFDKLGREPQSLRDTLKELQLAFEDERKNAFGGFLGKGISSTIAVLDEQYIGVSETPSVGNFGLNPLRFEPIFDRPRPPTLAMSENELTFLHSDGYFSDLIIDHQMSTPQSMEVRELMLKAYKSKLTPEQANQVVSLLKSDDQLVYHVGLAPRTDRLQPLVDNNPAVAEQCFVKLMNTSHSADFLNALISLQLSLHSMELVNKLTVCHLPKEILHIYIFNVIHSTRTATDKAIQTRHVRLVCVFLQSLIRNKIVNEQELFHESRIGVETQRFCTEFCKIKEANLLYRLLRQLDPQNPPLPSGDSLEPGNGSGNLESP